MQAKRNDFRTIFVLPSVSFRSVLMMLMLVPLIEILLFKP